MRTSIKDIADSLKLSKATISCILSGQGESKGFSEATIKRVKEYADSVNYRPNLLARSLSLGTTNTIGLIIPFIGDTFYAQMVQAIETEAIKNKYVLIVCSSEGDEEKEYELIKMLRSKQVDGIIIAPAKTSKHGIDLLVKENFPFVLIDRFFPGLASNYVIVNNFQASYKLVHHLIQKGSKKIALLTTDVHLYVMQQRIEGFHQALSDAGLTEDTHLNVLIDRKNYQIDTAKKLDCLFEVVPDIDGFFFSTHYLAMEALRYFTYKKIDYHTRFNLGCFHETAGLEVLSPEMSISRMPISDMGAQSVNILLENIANKDIPYQEMILENIFLPR